MIYTRSRAGHLNVRVGDSSLSSKIVIISRFAPFIIIIVVVVAAVISILIIIVVVVVAFVIIIIIMSIIN